MSNLPIIGPLIKPAAPAPAPMPSVISPESNDPTAKAQAAAKLEKAQAAQRKLGGSASTLLTSGSGLADKPQTSSTTLLGS